MGLLSLLFPIFLALILIVVLFGIIYLIKKREGEIKDEMKSLRDKLKDIDEDINEFIDLETLEETIEEMLEEEETFNFPCLIPPYSNGTCDKGYKIETGEDSGKKCCYPEESIKPSRFETKLKLANKIIQEILIAMVAGELLERMVKKLVGKTSVKAGGKVAVSATARAAKAARAAKRAAIAAKAVAMSIRTAIKASRALAKAIIGGPVGAAFLVADIIGMVLDIKDTAGYASFIPRDTFTNTKNVIDYEFGKALELEDLEFPMIYPLGQLYAKPYETAMELAYAKLIDKYFVSDMELEKNSEYKKAFDDYVDALIDSIVNETDDEPELPKKIEEYAIKIPEDRYTERDELIYEEMKNLIPLGDLVSNTQMYPKISSPKTIGISLSEQGAKRMNEKNKPKWLNDDMETLAAIYTDKYYIYESGTSDNPVMKEMTLPEKTVLATGYGTLFSMCEKRRKLKSSSAAITPTNYGSYFDFENSKCVFTSSLCNRYGLKLENNDCVMREGQEVAEIIFGTTTVRASIDQWQDRQNQFESGDFGEIASATVQTILDPTGLLAAIATQIPDEVFNPTNASGASYASSFGVSFNPF
jgi:hypothetical protein